LLSQAGEIVTREQLAQCIWGSDTHVDFNRGLAYCIAEIRRALGDNADNPRFVQTLPKRGFRFLAPVQSTPAQSASPSPVAAPLAGPALPPGAEPSWQRRAAVVAAIAALLAIGFWTLHGRLRPSRPVVAVAVFDNETGDSRYDLPVRVLSDTVVDRLTKLGPERVGVVGNVAELRMPRSKRDLKNIATETRAGFVVLGQFQRTSPNLTLLIHLIRLDDGTHVWTGRVARPPDDALAGLGDEAARMVEAATQQFVIGAS
jgi:TolB-like protein